MYLLGDMQHTLRPGHVVDDAMMTTQVRIANFRSIIFPRSGGDGKPPIPSFLPMDDIPPDKLPPSPTGNLPAVMTVNSSLLASQESTTASTHTRSSPTDKSFAVAPIQRLVSMSSIATASSASAPQEGSKTKTKGKKRVFPILTTSSGAVTLSEIPSTWKDASKIVSENMASMNSALLLVNSTMAERFLLVDSNHTDTTQRLQTIEAQLETIVAQIGSHAPAAVDPSFLFDIEDRVKAQGRSLSELHNQVSTLTVSNNQTTSVVDNLATILKRLDNSMQQTNDHLHSLSMPQPSGMLFNNSTIAGRARSPSLMLPENVTRPDTKRQRHPSESAGGCIREESPYPAVIRTSVLPPTYHATQQSTTHVTTQPPPQPRRMPMAPMPTPPPFGNYFPPPPAGDSGPKHVIMGPAEWQKDTSGQVRTYILATEGCHNINTDPNYGFKAIRESPGSNYVDITFASNKDAVTFVNAWNRSAPRQYALDNITVTLN